MAKSQVVDGCVESVCCILPGFEFKRRARVEELSIDLCMGESRVKVKSRSSNIDKS